MPKVIRERAGLAPGTELELRCRGGLVEIAPAPRRVRIVKRGQVCVAEAEDSSEPLTSEAVRRTQEQVRARDFEDS